MDYTADMLGAIQYGLSHMDGKSPQGEVKLYSDFAHKAHNKTDNMSAQQIIGHILKKL